MDIRFLDGEGSSSVRMTAFPSEDMDMRRAFCPFGGDGVISPSFRTIASPSKDSEIRSEGGDLKSFDASFSAGWGADAPPRRSVTDRFRLVVLSCDASGCVVSGVSTGSGSGSGAASSVGFWGASEVSESKLVWELWIDCSCSSLSSAPDTGSDSNEDCNASDDGALSRSPCSTVLRSTDTLSSPSLNSSAIARGARSS